METIADRINKVLKAKGIKKTEMARRLKISDSSVSTMCSGKSKPSGQTITMICHEFGVNEEWLRTGEGEMFAASPTSELDKLADRYHLRHKDYVFVEKLVNLSERERDTIFRFMVDVIAGATAGGADPDAYVFPRRDDDPAAIDVKSEVASYEEELILQKKVEDESSASDGRSASVG